MRISVIIPTRNHANRIAEPLKAVLGQTLPARQYEVIVVDNGSTDSTVQVLSRLAAEAPNLRWVSEPVVGKAAARNRGIRESASELVLFMDDDIRVLPDHLERHLAHHDDAGRSVAVIGAMKDISSMEPSWLEDYFRSRQWLIAPQTGAGLSPLQFVTGNVSLRRLDLEQARMGDADPPVYFDPAFSMRQDGELGYRLGRAGVQMVLAEDIECYHDHPRNLGVVLHRSYGSGYATAQLIQKHPELALEFSKLPASPVIKHGLFLACVLLLIPVFIVRPIWRQPSRKVIGAYLYYHRIRGYQQGLRALGVANEAGPPDLSVSRPVSARPAE